MIEKSKLVKIVSASCIAYTQIFLYTTVAGCGSQVAQAADLGDDDQKAQSTTVSTKSAMSDDERAIRDQANEYAKLYAAQDAKALAAMWASDGTFTDSSGEQHIGRAAIEDYFLDGFNAARPQTLDVSIASLKFPAPGVAIEEGTTRITSGPGLGSMGRYLVVHTKGSGNWLMQSVSETDCSAKSSAEYLKDLEWLIGSWSIKNQPEAAHLIISWSSNKTFIFCRFIKGDANDAPVEELQIIGWDPKSAQIVAWHFAAKGGFGHGSFSCDGKSWIERASGTEPDGRSGRAQYTLTRVDDNTFTWRSSKRSISGLPLPDSQEFTVTRDN